MSQFSENTPLTIPFNIHCSFLISLFLSETTRPKLVQLLIFIEVLNCIICFSIQCFILLILLQCLELARDSLNSEGYCVIGAYISPVNDAYKKAVRSGVS